MAQSGVLHSPRMATYTRLAARMEQSRCGRTVRDHSVYGNPMGIAFQDGNDLGVRYQKEFGVAKSAEHFG
jgi:hypothetical protein